MAPLCGCIDMLKPPLNEELFVLNDTSLWMHIYDNIIVGWRVIYVKWHLFVDTYICVNTTVEWRVIYVKWHLFVDAIYMLIPQLDEELFVLNGTPLCGCIYVNTTVGWRVIYVKWHLFVDAFVCFYHSWMKGYLW